MTTSTAPTASPAAAIAVLDPQSYADWDPLLDLFDELRAQSPVTLVESATGLCSRNSSNKSSSGSQSA